MAQLLITETEINVYKYLAPTINSAQRILPFCYEAQELDVRPLMGDEFYFIYQQQVLSEMTALHSGTTYTNANGNSVIFDGCIKVIVHYAYARFLENQQISVTANSVVSKESPYSTPTDPLTIKQRVTQIRSAAWAYWIECVKFIEAYRSTYPNSFPLWKGIRQTNTSGVKITAVDKFNRVFGWEIVCGKSCLTACNCYRLNGYCQ